MQAWTAYRHWRQAGDPAPRWGFARVSLHGQDLGLCATLEVVDDVYLGSPSEHSSGVDGNPYAGE